MTFQATPSHARCRQPSRGRRFARRPRADQHPPVRVASGAGAPRRPPARAGRRRRAGHRRPDQAHARTRRRHRGGDGGERRLGAQGGHRAAARPRGAGPQPARAERPRGVPHSAPAAGHGHRADHHAHRPHERRRSGDGPRFRRRRLRDQALQRARARGARARGAAPRTIHRDPGGRHLSRRTPVRRLRCRAGGSGRRRR